MMKITSTIVALVLLTILSTSAAFAQTPVSRDQAQNYYEKCRSKTDPRVHPETMDAFCSCTAKEMIKSMSVEDVEVMGSGVGQSRDKLNKMILEVYTPCMNYMVTEMVGAECMTNPDIDKFSGKINKPALCQCMGEETGLWFTQEGRALMRDVLAKTPNIDDPLGPVMETKAFKEQTYSSISTCLLK